MKWVQSNLWGMETDSGSGRFHMLCLVQSNLWGMETPKASYQWCNPTRFNRIYEEWKPGLKRSVCHNVNVQSNLWGMETTTFNDVATYEISFNRIYEEWKPEPITFSVETPYCSIESMRNGNILPARLRFATTVVQSNLWGMETKAQIANLEEQVRFNRIYEEWKQITVNQYAVSNPSFNRIYEEWKRLLGNCPT